MIISFGKFLTCLFRICTDLIVWLIDFNGISNGLGLFYASGDHRAKVEDCEKLDRYHDIGRELKRKQSNIQVTVIPIMVGALGKIPNNLEKTLEELEILGRINTFSDHGIVMIC